MRRFLININLFLCNHFISFANKFKVDNQWLNHQTVNKLTQEHSLTLKFIIIDGKFSYYVMSKLRDGLNNGKSAISKCTSRYPDMFVSIHCFYYDKFI